MSSISTFPLCRKKCLAKKRGDGGLLIPYEDKHPGFGDRIADEFFQKQARDCPLVK